jgi:hypothetical protein
MGGKKDVLARVCLILTDFNKFETMRNYVLCSIVSILTRLSKNKEIYPVCSGSLVQFDDLIID